jgi:hypothetical protein
MPVAVDAASQNHLQFRSNIRAISLFLSGGEDSPALFLDKGRNEACVAHTRDRHAVFFGPVKKFTVPPFKPFHANTEYCRFHNKHRLGANPILSAGSETLLKARTKPARCGGDTKAVRKKQMQSNIQLAVIEGYLQDLGSWASSEPYSGLATASSLVLDGKGSPLLKSLCLNTISWQEMQFMAAASVINFLLEKDLLYVDYATVIELSIDHSFMAYLWETFGTIKPPISQLIANQGAMIFFMCMGLCIYIYPCDM